MTYSAYSACSGYNSLTAWRGEAQQERPDEASGSDETGREDGLFIDEMPAGLRPVPRPGG